MSEANDFKRVYLCGPMSKVKDFNVPAFERVAADLEAKGFSVVSPSRLAKSRPGMEWHVYMRWCLAELVRCDAVVLVGNWRDRSFKESEGVRDELYNATRMKIPVFVQVDEGVLSEIRTNVWKPAVLLESLDEISYLGDWVESLTPAF